MNAEPTTKMAAEKMMPAMAHSPLTPLNCEMVSGVRKWGHAGNIDRAEELDGFEYDASRRRSYIVFYLHIHNTRIYLLAESGYWVVLLGKERLPWSEW